MDLTTEALIAAMTRFISRRGVISEIHSDNATNYVGASRKLNKVFNDLAKNKSTQQFFERHSTVFKFIPPRSPQLGGLWERAIQSAKVHMRRVIGDQILTLEEFSTLLARVEAILNSRPIMPLSDDPNDLQALTPGHFIAGGPLVTLPETSFLEVSANRLNKWQLVQSYAQHIWQRWNKEYLCTLQHRTKWYRKTGNLQPDDLVLLHEDNLPPLQWRLGRVLEVFPGQDGIVRVVNVKTAAGIYKRSSVKLSLLPISD